jgi:alkaline phosphatase D
LSRSRPCLLLSLLTLAVVAQAASATATGLLAAIGDVGPTTAVLWARADRETDVAVTYGPVGNTQKSATLRVSRSAGLTGKLRLDDLKPATRYAYRVRATTEVSGEFVTAPAPDTTARVRLIWSGDLGGGSSCRRVDDGYRIFRAIARQEPDVFLFVGDTIYADHVCGGPGLVPGFDFVATTLAQFRAKHAYNHEDPALVALLARTSVSAIWDDHEVRNDFAGPSEPLMPVGRQAFLEYWPILPVAEEPTRLYRSLRWGRLLEVFILDTRQYRSDNCQPDGPSKTMLGAAQRRWLVETVTASNAVWKVVVSSVPLSVSTGRNCRDSWSNATLWGLPEENGTGFATERDAILRTFRQHGVKNLLFLTTDVHHAELIRHHPTTDFSFHEFIAGPLSATFGRPRPLDQGLNPRSLFAQGGVNNFGEITIEVPHLTARILDEEGRVLFSHVIGPE